MAKGKTNTVAKKKIIQGVAADKTNPNLSLDEMLGDKVNNPFRTVNLQVFEKSLATMDLLDMMELATKAELRPVHDRRIMKERLLKQFKAKVVGLKHQSIPRDSLKNKNKPLSKKRSSAVDRIMREGR